MTINFEIPHAVDTLLHRLESNGFQAFVVGGCVRDSILGRTPNDWDITTDATPEEILRVFSGFRTIPTGIEHGTITVMVDGTGFEITTFRIDGDYSDNRRPDNVVFTSDIVEDLARRDFTINAMAFNPRVGLVDPFDGMEDITWAIIRCVGNPDERFAEDALRMMRAFRFDAQLDGFSIHEDTWDSINRNSHRIANISAERIRDELSKILVSSKPFVIQDMNSVGLLRLILPEVSACFDCEQNNSFHFINVGVHTMIAVRNIKNDLILRLTMLFHDIGKPVTKSVGSDGIFHFYGHDEVSATLANSILKRLRFDNDTIEKVVNLVSFHMVEIRPEKRLIKRLMHKLGEDDFRNLLSVRLADKSGMKQNVFMNEVENNVKVKAVLDEILNEHEGFSLKHLAINGDDLKAIGFKQGVELGNTLKRLMEAVIENPELNDRDILLRMAIEL